MLRTGGDTTTTTTTTTVVSREIDEIVLHESSGDVEMSDVVRENLDSGIIIKLICIERQWFTYIINHTN